MIPERRARAIKQKKEAARQLPFLCRLDVFPDGAELLAVQLAQKGVHAGEGGVELACKLPADRRSTPLRKAESWMRLSLVTTWTRSFLPISWTRRSM